MSHYRGRPWRRTVAQVLRRDGGICWLCGRPGADSADHVIPESLGGSRRPSNLRAVHHNRHPAPGVSCNRIRGNRTPDEARAILAAILNQPTPTQPLTTLGGNPPTPHTAPPAA